MMRRSKENAKEKEREKENLEVKIPQWPQSDDCYREEEERRQQNYNSSTAKETEPYSERDLTTPKI